MGERGVIRCQKGCFQGSSLPQGRLPLTQSKLLKSWPIASALWTLRGLLRFAFLGISLTVAWFFCSPFPLPSPPACGNFMFCPGEQEVAVRALQNAF